MKISEIIEGLKKVQEDWGDVETGCDIQPTDKSLSYDEDLDCIFGED